MQALVIGGGVAGLTTALVLLEAGWEVKVRAREWTPRTVSDVAAAIWQPYQVAHPRALTWALASLTRFQRLASQPACGVRPIEGWQLHCAITPPPEWARHLDPFHPLTAEQLPDGYACGYSYQTMLIETPIYMRWLQDEVARHGGACSPA